MTEIRAEEVRKILQEYRKEEEKNMKRHFETTYVFKEIKEAAQRGEIEYDICVPSRWEAMATEYFRELGYDVLDPRCFYDTLLNKCVTKNTCGLPDNE